MAPLRRLLLPSIVLAVALAAPLVAADPGQEPPHRSIPCVVPIVVATYPDEPYVEFAIDYHCLPLPVGTGNPLDGILPG